MKKVSILFLAAMVIVVLGLPGGVIRAAGLTGMSDTMTRLQISTASNHTIVFTTPTGVAEGETITLTFDADFTMGSVGEDDVDIEDDTVDLTTAANCDAADEASVAVSGQVVTITICAGDGGAIAATSEVTIEIGTNATASGTGANQITNPGTAQEATIDIAGTMTDSGSLVVAIIDDDTVSVTATVDPSLTFSISDTSIGFGSLSAVASRYATGDTTGSGSEVEAHTLIAGTNATGGYSITLNGATLTSGADTITAIGASNTAPSTGSEQFGVRYTASGGSGSVSVPYAAAGFAFDTGSFPDEVASAAGASADTTYSARYVANIASNTEAGTYTADLTYIATATF